MPILSPPARDTLNFNAIGNRGDLPTTRRIKGRRLHRTASHFIGIQQFPHTGYEMLQEYLVVDNHPIFDKCGDKRLEFARKIAEAGIGVHTDAYDRQTSIAIDNRLAQNAAEFSAVEA
jgi:hypothetical protein